MKRFDIFDNLKIGDITIDNLGNPYLVDAIQFFDRGQGFHFRGICCGVSSVWNKYGVFQSGNQKSFDCYMVSIALPNKNPEYFL